MTGSILDASTAAAAWSPHMWNRGAMRGPTPLRVLRRTLELVWGHGGRNVPLASNDALPEKYSQK